MIIISRPDQWIFVIFKFSFVTCMSSSLNIFQCLCYFFFTHCGCQ